MEAILGLSAFYHDSAAALMVDGKIVAAAQEERFTRKKFDASFPALAARYVLQEAGLKGKDLDREGAGCGRGTDTCTTRAKRGWSWPATGLAVRAKRGPSSEPSRKEDGYERNGPDRPRRAPGRRAEAYSGACSRSRAFRVLPSFHTVSVTVSPGR